MLYLGQEPNWVDRSFKHRAEIAWNSLPDTIKQVKNPLSCNRKIKSIKTYVDRHPKGMSL